MADGAFLYGRRRVVLSGVRVGGNRASEATPTGFGSEAVAAAVLASASVFAYVWLAGLRPSLVRAATMAALAQAGRHRGEQPKGIELVATSAIVVLVIDPSATTASSLELSVLALAGILLLGPSSTLRLPGILPPALRGTLGVAVGAQLLTLPLVLHSFGAVRPVGVPAGLVLIPLPPSPYSAVRFPLSPMPFPAVFPVDSANWCLGIV